MLCAFVHGMEYALCERFNWVELIDLQPWRRCLLHVTSLEGRNMGKWSLSKCGGSGKNRSCSGHNDVGCRIGHYPLRVRLFNLSRSLMGKTDRFRGNVRTILWLRMFLVIGRWSCLWAFVGVRCTGWNAWTEQSVTMKRKLSVHVYTHSEALLAVRETSKQWHNEKLIVAVTQARANM